MSSRVSQRRYGGKTAEERRAERREKLIDTGLELFGTRGYSATSIELLCAQAGLNARYFYEEFDGREGLLGAIYDRHVETVYPAVASAIAAAHPDPRARLAAGLHAFIHHTLADPRAARINYFEMVGVSRELEGRRRAVLRRYADLAAAQLADLLPVDRVGREDRLDIAAVALVSATDGLIIDRLSAGGAGLPDAAEMDRLADALTALFATAIGV